MWHGCRNYCDRMVRCLAYETQKHYGRTYPISSLCWYEQWPQQEICCLLCVSHDHIHGPLINISTGVGILYQTNCLSDILPVSWLFTVETGLSDTLINIQFIWYRRVFTWWIIQERWWMWKFKTSCEIQEMNTSVNFQLQMLWWKDT